MKRLIFRKNKYLLLRMILLAFIMSIHIVYGQKNKIVIEGKLPKSVSENVLTLQTFPLYKVEDYDTHNDYSFKGDPSGAFRIVIYTDTPALISSFPILGKTYYFTEPGDSIYIQEINDSLSFSGIGADKFSLVYQALQATNYIKGKWLKNNFQFNSLEKYINISQCCDSIAARKIELLERFKPLLSAFTYTYLYAHIISEGEYLRTNAFGTLRIDAKKAGLSSLDLVNVFDTTLAKSKVVNIVINDTNTLSSNFSFFLHRMYNPYLYYRSKKFSEDNFNSPLVTRVVDRYYFVKNRYSGLAQQRGLATIITRSLLKKGGITHEVQMCIQDYLSLPGYGEYKTYINDYFNRAIALNSGQYAPDFTLMDKFGKKVSLNAFKGKIVVLDFWFTGCAGCIQMATALKKVEQSFRNNSLVEFISISIDEDKIKWIASVEKAKYTTGTGVNLYTNGKGDKDSTLRFYNVTSYPSIFILDTEGRIVKSPAPDPRKDGGQELTTLIKGELVKKDDGPYVLYKGNSIITKYVKTQNGESILDSNSIDISNKEKLVLKVQSDISDELFQVKLKEQIQPEPSEFSKASKLLVISDIEGNFNAFKRLLQSNGVLDINYNWTFGKGHLVLVGDFFDRGEQVNEVLWLIYSLEKKAKVAGGYVHFIIGNHEVMNLNGDIRYVQEKYKKNLDLLNEEYVNLYGNDSEIGRWLRSKNIIEKIGDILFVHGGIAPVVNSLPMSLKEINDLAKLHYDQVKVKEKSDNILSILFSSKVSPFWFRGYYDKQKSTVPGFIDSTLVKFRVKYIVTGHTIVSDHVSTHYDGKIINVDTKHAEGKSEALLIEDEQYYRVNAEGKRNVLFNPNLAIANTY